MFWIEFPRQQVVQRTTIAVQSLCFPVFVGIAYILGHISRVSTRIRFFAGRIRINVPQYDTTNLGSVASQEVSLPTTVFVASKGYLASVAPDQDGTLVSRRSQRLQTKRVDKFGERQLPTLTCVDSG